MSNPTLPRFEPEDVCTVKVFNKDGDGGECSQSRPCSVHDGPREREPDYGAVSEGERHLAAWEEKRRLS